ncbi:peptidoglycan glycosyltransferase [gut metagenome]|uniref:Peptidoglycan glycosyltransferase n=1 Tax=gut metagenome TaxID=749906 RepID=J9GNG9_9ZZZZ
MASDINFSQRKFIIGGIVVFVIIIYIIRLFTLQLMSDDYKKNADSNAFRKDIQYPSRGLILDRKGRLMVYNEPSYNIMVVMNDQLGIDTLDFCKTMGITPEFYIAKMKEIKSKRNYSRYTPQLFMSQIPAEEFSVFREKLFRFRGFSVEKRANRHYTTELAAHLLGDVGEVNEKDIKEDNYYQSGDYIGKLGVERSYEKQLRGEKGMRIMLRDVHGRTQGHYQDEKYDKAPVPGKNVTLSIDMELQRLAERLLKGKLGSIVAIEPSTGEVLCMASAPTYDPHIMVGRDRGKSHRMLYRDPMKPLLNRAIMGTYPPGSTFKVTQALLGLQEGIITPDMTFPCSHGFNYKGLHLGCHSHASPIALVPAIATSCNAYFCWNLYRMFGNRTKYETVQDAMTCWKDHLVAMGFGYKLGIDLPGERRGMIPNAAYYDKHIRGKWNGLTVISISIGQGEVTSTPLQIANLAATVANRGHYYIPHVVKKIQNEQLDPMYLQPNATLVDAKWYDYAVAGMRQAVTGGTCRGANIPGIEVCGKTGTAQNRGQDHSVFMGFAPMNDPKIAVAVYIENGGFGAVYGVPIGGLIIEQYLNGKLSETSELKAQGIENRKIVYGKYER